MIDKHNNWTSNFKKIAVYERTELYPKESTPRHNRGCDYIVQILLSYSRPLTPSPFCFLGIPCPQEQHFRGHLGAGKKQSLPSLEITIRAISLFSQIFSAGLKKGHVSASPPIDVTLTVDPESQTSIWPNSKS
ncbi:UNVERIFIED_CONTAM: hypothetical protein K2H54_041504 [Gekko kuhli]